MNGNTSHRPDLTTRALLDMASEAGFQVSADQLKRWSRRCLLPRSRQVRQPGQRGSVTLWPTESGERLLAICQLRPRFGRRLDALLLALWWDGWPVNHGVLLTSLGRQIARLPVADGGHTGSEEERLDALDELVKSVKLRRLRGPLGKAIRRAGKNGADRRSLIWAICAIAYGIEPPLETADVGHDERGLGDLLADGLPLRLFAKQLSEVGERVPTEDLVLNVAGLADQIGPMLEFAGAVIAAGDVGELNQARDQARSLMKLAVMSDAMLSIDPNNGLGLIGELIPTDNDPDTWAFILVSTLWQRHTMPDRLDSVTVALDEHAPAAEAFATVLDAVPGFREAIVEAGGDNAVLADLTASRPELRAALHAFLDEHPDIGAALD